MKRHLYTIVFVCLMVLAVWWAGLMPAQAQITSGGSGGNCTPSHWANLPASPAALTCFSIPDAASCTAGTAVTTSGSTPCQLTWTGSNWLPAGNVTSSAAGGLTTAGNNLTASGGTVGISAPVTVANGGTGATAAGATAAGNIGAAAVANNLSDLANAATARTNLGLGTSATVNTGTSGATLGLLNGNLTFGGTDTFSSGPTMSGANITFATIPDAALVTTPLLPTNNLSDVGNAASARTNLGLGTLATASSPLSLANGGTAATSASAARTSLGLGSIATVNSPVPVANGGTNATSAGAAAANNIGALAEASNLSDLASASSARTNLGLGSIATVNSPVPAANGGTGTAYGAPGAYTQKTNSSTGTTANSIYTTNTSQQAVNVTAGSISGALGICDSGCGTSGTGIFFSGPGDHTCNFDGSVTAKDYVGISASVNGDCTDLGASLPTGTELIGQVDQATAAGAGAYTVFFYGPDFPGTGGGGVNTGVLGNSPLYAATTTIGPVTNEIHANTSTLAAALAAITQTTWTATHGYVSGQLLYDGTNTERIADWQPSTVYTSSSILVPFTGNSGGYRFTQSAATCTSGTTKPTWPQTSGNTVNDGPTPCVWHNSGATGCTSGSSTPSWSGTLGGVVNDGNCPWMNVIKGAAAPSVQSNVVLDPGKTYTVSTATMIGGTNLGQTLDINGANVSCTGTGGAGTACLVLGNWGTIKGRNRFTSSISATGSTSVDSLVESSTAYYYSALGLQYQATNMDVEHVGINQGGATINQAALWVSGIDGLGNFQDLFIGGSTATSSPAGILVDDAPTGSAFTGMFWNALKFSGVWVGVGTDVHGVEVLCGATSNSSGSNLNWDGGAITDGRAAATLDELDVVGNGGNCINITQKNTYYESFSGQTGNFVDLSGASDVSLDENYYNGGPTLTDCIQIANANANGLHATAKTATCTNMVVNNVAGQTLTLPVSGSVKRLVYNWDNPSFSTGPINQVGGLTNPWGPGGPAGTYYSAAGTPIPACAAAYERYMACVSDAVTCVDGTTYASGGGTDCQVQCNNAGTAWVENGLGCN